MTAFITGGGAGIGRAVAMLCAAQHSRVAIVDIDAGAANRAADEARNRGAPVAISLPCDVADREALAQVYNRAVAGIGVPDAVFAGAGIDRGGAIHELPGETWDRVLRTNLDGVFNTVQPAVRAMIEAGVRGSIVCASSPAAFVGFAAGGASAYSASKGGISALVRCLAVDCARYGIRVNAVVPGPTETAMMWANVSTEDVPELRRGISKEVPLGRLADPEEPARAVLWLFSSESSYVTGSHLVCDGGVLAKASISF